MILLVDDNRDLLAAFEVCLKLRGFEAVCCFSGQDGLNFLSSHPWPELILLDFSMPGMNGEEFMKSLISQYGDRVKTVKIVGMSCYAPDYVGISSFKQLVTAYAEKPSTLDALEVLVKTYVQPKAAMSSQS